jgi:hypothetical protein
MSDTQDTHPITAAAHENLPLPDADAFDEGIAPAARRRVAPPPPPRKPKIPFPPPPPRILGAPVHDDPRHVAAAARVLALTPKDFADVADDPMMDDSDV